MIPDDDTKRSLPGNLDDQWTWNDTAVALVLLLIIYGTIAGFVVGSLMYWNLTS